VRSNLERLGDESEKLVGPVLRTGVTSSAVIAAIRDLNNAVTVLDRGSYLRVAALERCVVTRDAIEAHLGRSFQLPGDLEALMPAFAGHFSVNDEEAKWTLKGGKNA
jgi:hypothetical protein